MFKHSHLNRILAFVLILALVLPAGVATHVKAETSVTGVINAKELYMRTGAGTEYDHVTAKGKDVVLVFGQEVTVLGEKDGWYHLRAVYNGEVVEGYSLSGKDGNTYITIPEGSSLNDEYRKGTITALELNVRSGPSTDYAIIRVNDTNVVLTEGTEVSILGENNSWYHISVKFKGTKVEGYCLGKYVEASEEKAEEPDYAYGEIIATKLNVRTGPSTDYKILQSGGENVVLSNGQEVTILEEKDGWYHITAAFGGKLIDGYCLGSYVEVTEGTPAASSTGDSGKTGETTDDKPVKEPEDKPSKEPDGKSETEEDGPYVPTSPTDLSHGVPEGYELATRNFAAKYSFRARVIPEEGLNLRASASATDKVKAVIPGGDEVQVLKSVLKTTKEDGKSVKTRWFRVVAVIDGEYVDGYVISNYLEIIPGDGIPATTKYASQKLLKKVTSSSVVRTSSSKIVKLSKGTAVTIIGEKTAKSGNKYYKVTAEYKGETVTGYIKAMRLTFTETASLYEAKYLVEKAVPDEPAEPESSIEYSFKGANAIIKDAAGLTVHKEPKNASDIIYTAAGKAVMLYTGDSVEIIDVTADGNSVWCYIRLYFKDNEYYGYIRSSHVETDSELVLMSDELNGMTNVLDFEAKLEREGFPESYKVLLRKLHEQYPSWEFKAYHTGYDWNETIANESVVGENLLPNTYSTEWKSLEAGAYNWKNDTFVVFDGSYWVTASEKAVRYYMDPRNFINENNIFMFENLTFNPEYQTRSGVATILKTSVMGNGTYSYKDDFGTPRTTSYVDTFMMAAQYTGVSPFHLAARSKIEVTIGANSFSNSATGTVSGYEGLYNFYNIAAYHSTEPLGAVKNGLKYAKNGDSSATLNVSTMIPWTNQFRAIMGGAYWLGYKYINKGQDTLYLQKFNVTKDGYYPAYTHQYMANIEAPHSEGLSMKRAYSEIEDITELPLVFSIPVFLNMPEEPSPLPEKEYNPNNWLKTLKVYDINGDALALTPTFDYTEDQEYSLIVGYETDYLKLKTTTVSQLAEVTSKSTWHPEEGYNKITVKVKAENGDVRKYIINVIREENPNPEPEVTEPVVEDTEDTGDVSDTGDTGDTSEATEGGEICETDPSTGGETVPGADETGSETGSETGNETGSSEGIIIIGDEYYPYIPETENE